MAKTYQEIMNEARSVVPEVSADEIFRSVERFYRRYYFSRRYIWKSLKRMAGDPHEAKRMLQEGKQFIGAMLKRRQIANQQSASA